MAPKGKSMTASCAVLVVDDDQGIRELLAEALEMEGFDVKAAGNGAQALTLMEHWRPDVIVLDLNMPIMDGWAFRAAQRGKPAIADIPIIVFSAAFQGGQQIDVLNAAAFLPKPCDLDHLIRIVGMVVQS
jgi:CheY-like chemotaxis protein